MKLFGHRIEFFRAVRYDSRTLLIEIGTWGQIRITKELAKHLSGISIRRPGVVAENWPEGFTKILQRGRIIPRWYGFAKFDFASDCGVYAPVPFNLIIALFNWFLHRIWWPIRFSLPWREDTRDELLKLIAGTYILDHPSGEEFLAKILIDLGYRRVYRK